MSRIGKVPIPVPNGVQATVDGPRVRVKGPKGEREVDTRGNVTVRREGATILVDRHGEERHDRAFHGLYHRLISSAIVGVTQGFQKSLEMSGVGYKAELRGKELVVNAGYSHEVKYTPPPSVTIAVPAPTKITIEGNDKQAVGQAAAKIRSISPPEPYKGKGIKYADETVRRKAGKTGKAGGK